MSTYRGEGGKAGPAPRQPTGGGTIAISTRRHYEVLAAHAAAEAEQATR